VSPIIGGRVVRGMADVCLTAIGVETSAAAVAAHYGPRTDGGLLDAWLIAEEDEPAAADVARLGIRPLVAPLWMTDAARSSALAEAALTAALAGTPESRTGGFPPPAGESDAVTSA
jgi:LPPG:FO 2-phospho-L-lactate transferase